MCQLRNPSLTSSIHLLLLSACVWVGEWVCKNHKRVSITKIPDVIALGFGLWPSSSSPPVMTLMKSTNLNCSKQFCSWSCDLFRRFSFLHAHWKWVRLGQKTLLCSQMTHLSSRNCSFSQHRWYLSVELNL